jgi:hypothetical protein
MDSAAYYVQESGSTEKKRDYLYEEYRFHKKKGELTSAMEFLEKYSAKPVLKIKKQPLEKNLKGCLSMDL